jgi:hypothetical protein
MTDEAFQEAAGADAGGSIGEERSAEGAADR